MTIRSLWVAAAAMLLAACAETGTGGPGDDDPASRTAASQRFDPSARKGPGSGPENEVLVLGTPHLSGLPDTFEPEQLAPLIDRLAAWGPDLIAIEAIPGPYCAFMRDHPARYEKSVETYCWDPAPAAAATGLSVAEATAEAERLLAAWPEMPSPADRRRLAATFLASGDRASALVQWLQLPEAERRTGEGLDGVLVEILDAQAGRQNETSLIAAPLAARLGLERLQPMDDHTADRPFEGAERKAYGAAISAAWDNPASRKRRAMADAAHDALGKPGALMDYYQALNAPEMAPLIYESDFGAALKEPSPERFGRRYLAYWETRNLRMAANIRDALGPRPGSKALVIVGASHKPYLDDYLDRMHDVAIVDAGTVLD